MPLYSEHHAAVVSLPAWPVALPKSAGNVFLHLVLTVPLK